MNATKHKTLGVVLALVGALALTGSAAHAESRHGRHDERESAATRHQDHHGHHRDARVQPHFYRYPVRRWVAPAPPRLSRPAALPRAHAIVVPRVIRPSHRRAYAPYYAGTVFYAPYDIDLDVYYFPVNLGGRLTYQPYYYYNNDLFFTLSVGRPHFYFQIGF